MHKTTKQLAKHFREVYFGGNWTASSVRQHLEDVTWQEATYKIANFNTIETLVHHLHYYVSLDLKVLNGGPLKGSDKESFIHTPVTSAEEWNLFLSSRYEEAEAFARAIENLDDAILWNDFVAEKYGNYYRNILGIIEHTHYHLGQLVFLKKLIRNEH